MKESFGLYWPSVMKFQPTSTFSQTQAPASLCLHSPHCFVFMFLFHFTEVYLYLKAVHSFAFLFMFYMLLLCMCSSNQISCSVASDSLRPHESQHARPPCPSPTPGVHSDSRPSGQWCHPAISSFVVPFSSCPQSLPASESFPMSQLFAWGGQSTRVSALASFLVQLRRYKNCGFTTQFCSIFFSAPP